MKPVAMVADAIRDGSRRNGIVLDPFAGSGSTLIAAQRTGRRGFGVELDLLYCDVRACAVFVLCAGCKPFFRQPARNSRK
jgi:DNA modification methylase